MDKNVAFQFIEENKYYLFPNKKFTEEDLENALIMAPDDYANAMYSFPFKDPKSYKKLSILVGILGIDRFSLGQIGIGFLKYITFGAFGIFYIKDVITAEQRCREYNAKKIIEGIGDVSVIDKAAKKKAIVQSQIKYWTSDESNEAKRHLRKAREGLKEWNDSSYIH